MKEKLIKEYGRDRLKVIEKDGEKYVHADFLNFVIDKLDVHVERMQKLLFDMDFEDVRREVGK